MRKNLLVLAGLAGLLGACHSNGAYLSGNGVKPRGPGVVDCGWYANDDAGNTYVAQYCAPSRAAEVAYMAAQQFPAVVPLETKWNGIPDACGTCPGDTQVVIPAEPISAAPGGADRRAAMVAAIAARGDAPAAPRRVVMTAPAPVATAADHFERGGRTAREMATGVPEDSRRARTVVVQSDDWEGQLPPPRPGAPLPLPQRPTVTIR
jgi:hypothetical protein